jgi:hypothetical protein
MNCKSIFLYFILAIISIFLSLVIIELLRPTPKSEILKVFCILNKKEKFKFKKMETIVEDRFVEPKTITKLYKVIKNTFEEHKKSKK